MTTDREISFIPYNEDIGSFSKMTNSTVGKINFALNRSKNVNWQNTEITVIIVAHGYLDDWVVRFRKILANAVEKNY